MDFDAILTLSQQGKMFANPRRIALLKAIAATGSISQGAKQAGISYKAAYDAIKEMNNQSESPLIESEKGGKGGGGASLTHHGQRLVQMYELLDQIQSMGLEALNDESVPLHSLLGVMSKLSLQTSARNQLFGTIEKIENHALHDLITVVLQEGIKLTATITHGSTIRLDLHPGKEVVALIKGPAIDIKLSSSLAKPTPEQNWLKGKVRDIASDDHSVEVTLTLNHEDEICALIDKGSEDITRLVIGDDAYAVFPSAQVILATLS
ncbi:TOBE domain-containing protein [Photobacterium lutimaris]|uniref:Molybdenum-dependent transcriptional regulator n=1 Tax=Photobacterium lutimaris TaxID=388278 RepID=A0A2T3J336_9GAMM|nr:TOBE domain-containing protein [Photobacterium lutimaris]PSU35690.1 molybdenum-dependent transcriptional regulator [Photobacterium lutimaris]TDR78751.1 molybdate transport repressor ModE [Photobacterium lutimaris]